MALNAEAASSLSNTIASRRLAVVVCGLLATSCGAHKTSEHDEPTNNTAELGGDVSGSEAGDTSPTTWPPGELNCSRQTARDACEERTSTLNGAPIFCTWVEWHPVDYDARTDTCSFGDPEGRCDQINLAGDGCGHPGLDEWCAHNELGVRRGDGARVLLAKGPWCDPGEAVDAELCNNESYPECACLCAPDFPN